MVGTILKSDLGDWTSNQFLGWVDNLHASDPPLPPIEIPNPLDAVASTANQIGNTVLPIPGQAVDTARSAFLDWTDSLSATPTSGGTTVSPPTETTAANTTHVSYLPPAETPAATAGVSPPPSEFLNWTQQVDSGLSSPSAPVTAPSPPGVATAAPALHPVEEPTTPSPSAGPTVGDRWKTQFDFGATYTGNYRTGTPHRGVDLVPSNGQGIGTEVDAFVPGTVSNIFRDSGAGGLIVYVQDADGLTHAYMHLNDVMPGLQVGQRVDRGTPLAHMGESGTEGSPHLHYEVRKNAANGDPLNQLIDPRPYLAGSKQPGPGGPIGAVTGVVQDVAQGVAGAIDSSSPAAFARSFAPYARYAADKLGIDPTWVTAMAASESNYGRAPGNELFGVKALPGQKSQTLATHEGEYGGVAQNASFAAYDSPLEAVNSWVDLIRNHYKSAVGAPDLGSFVHGLKQGGYFTAAEPEYLGIVRGIANRVGGDVQDALSQGRAAVSNVATGASSASDALGASQRLVADTAQKVGSAASEKAQDVSSALTDLLQTFRAPVATGLQSAANQVGLGPTTRDFVSGLIEDLNQQNQQSQERAETSPLSVERLLQAPLEFGTGGGAPDLSRAVSAGLERAGVPGHEQAGFEVGPLQVGPRELAGLAAGVLTPAGPEGEAAQLAGVGERAVVRGARSLDLDALASLRRAATAATQPPLEGATAPLSRGGRIADAIDKAVAVTVSNMLSAPASLFTNATAVTQNLTRPIESAATAAIKAAGGDIPGARTELGAAGRDLVGQGAALGEAFARFGSTFARGQERPLDVRREAWPGLKGMLATPALRLNAATDELVRSLGQAGAQAAELTRLQAQHPEMTAAELTERFGPLLHKVGQDAAAQVGFQSGGTGIGSAISQWRSALTRSGASIPQRIGGAALHVAVPFSNVPDVILTRGLRRLPVVNELAGVGQAAAAASRGETDQAQRIGARTLITTAVNLAIYSQVQQGNVTGSGPDDPAKRAALMAARDSSGNPIWRPNSIRVGDRWLNYGGLGPLSLQLGGIANAHEQYVLEDRKVSPNLAGAIARGVIGTVGDAWYLQSVADLFDAVKTGSFDRAAGRVLGSTADRIIPLGGAVNAIRQWQDQVVRDPQNPIQREMNRIPGLSELVQPKIEPSTGEAVQEPRDVVSVLTRASAPGQPDPINAELARHNLGVSDAPDTLTRGSATLQLTDDEQRRFLELSGPEIAKRVRSVTSAEGYARLLPDQQRSRLEAAIRVGRDAGEARLWATIPQDERTRRVYEYRDAQKRRTEPQVILSR